MIFWKRARCPLQPPLTAKAASGVGPQVQLITNQVSQQQRLGVRIRELSETMIKHNDELEVITQNVQIEIFDKIDAMMGGKTMNVMSCCITLLMIFVIVGVVYYVVSEFYY